MIRVDDFQGMIEDVAEAAVEELGAKRVTSDTFLSWVYEKLGDKFNEERAIRGLDAIPHDELVQLLALFCKSTDLRVPDMLAMFISYVIFEKVPYEQIGENERIMILEVPADAW